MVALDTNIYIYFLEKNPEFFGSAERSIKYALDSGPICVPTITLTEIMSGIPNEDLLNFFAGNQFVVYELTTQIAVLAGKLCYQYKSLKSADAIHLATALSINVSQFITNDERLEELKLSLEVVPLSQFA
jgi:predicted nucleic acid-binding protein